MAGCGRITATHTSVVDFEPSCKCGDAAVAYLEIHPLDYCTKDRPTWSALLCRECLARDVRRVQNILLDGPYMCASCLLPIVSMSDIIVRLCPLWAMGET